MFAIPHPLRLMIDSQYQFLKSMIVRFPQLLNEWVETQFHEVAEMSNDCAQGDEELYRTVYNSEICRIDNCSGEEQLFNQAMLIMVYSYYESILQRIADELSTEPQPSKIANLHGKLLNDEMKKNSIFIHETILPLRNQLCHNNNGTLFKRSQKQGKNNILNLAKLKVIDIEDNKITISNPNFICDVLEIEHDVLSKLADICGYKTIKI